MSKIKEFFNSPHIQIALTTGFSIIVMALFSKRVLTEPIGYLSLAIPPFIATVYESLLSKYQTSRFLKTWYWIVAILIATLIVIMLHI